MLVRDVMLRDVSVVGPETSLREAAQRMWVSRHGLLVIGDKDGIHGLLTMRSLVLAAEAQAQGYPIREVGDIASDSFVIAREDEEVQELALRMIDASARRAIVVDGAQQVTGLVSPLELARHLSRARRSAAVDQAPQEPSPAAEASSRTNASAE